MNKLNIGGLAADDINPWVLHQTSSIPDRVDVTGESSGSIFPPDGEYHGGVTQGVSGESQMYSIFNLASWKVALHGVVRAWMLTRGLPICQTHIRLDLQTQPLHKGALPYQLRSQAMCPVAGQESHLRLWNQVLRRERKNKKALGNE